MPKPLIAAEQAVSQATDAVLRARTFYDYMQSGDTHIVLRGIHETLIAQLQKLNALVLNND
jgi:hypothetical protein